MIIYDGVSIESIANVRVEDIRVSPIALNPVSRQRAIRFGSDFVRMAGGQRTISITFSVLDQNQYNRHASLMALTQWAKNDREYLLELPQDPMRGLYCVCTARPEPSLRQWWENRLRLVFTCFDNPYWTDKAEKTVSCGTQFTVLGDAPPLMRIERTLGSDATNQTYTMTVPQGSSSLVLQSMTFSTIPTGSMEVDLNRQTAAVGNTSIMQYYAPSGSFLIPRTGTQMIAGTGTVKYRERWE